MDWKETPTLELLQTHDTLLKELARRGVVSTRDNPLGGYAEWLVCKGLKLKGEGNSQKFYDGTDPRTCDRYQIKGRRPGKGGRVTSPIKGLTPRGFDFVVALVFEEDFAVRHAVKVSHKQILEFSARPGEAPRETYTLNLSEKFTARDDVESIKDAILPYQEKARRSPPMVT